MPTLKKYSDFQSLKAGLPLERTLSPQLTTQRNYAWMEFVKDLQQAKIKALASQSGNGKKLLK